MKVSDFDYNLPKELIAQKAIEPRDASRLLILERKTKKITHRHFRDIVDYLYPGDVLVLNQTKVIPARLFGHKVPTGGRVEILLLKPVKENTWEALVRPGKRVHAGDVIDIANGGLRAQVIDYTQEGRLLQFQNAQNFDALLQKLGQIPLPPYIKEKIEDPSRYQTVYASASGSVAAPTAGLHFTEELLEEIRKKGVRVTSLILHVGVGTFRPVKAEKVEEHHMHKEYYEVSQDAAQIINETRQKGGRVVAVGTTVVRTLESVADENGIIYPGQGETELFIYPGYKFKAIDALLTNFHLPRSTLLMLVSAFTGIENIKTAYKEAIRQRYRFYSFGDAMFII